jgi:hypothetical protein
MLGPTAKIKTLFEKTYINVYPIKPIFRGYKEFTVYKGKENTVETRLF